MEVRLKTPEKYRFPAFETLQWYAAKYYTQQLKDLNSRRVCITLKFYNCLKFLNNTIKKWINSKDVRKSSILTVYIIAVLFPHFPFVFDISCNIHFIEVEVKYTSSLRIKKIKRILYIKKYN